MDIQQIRAKRVKLEIDILKSIIDFSKETNAYVNRVNFTFDTMDEIGGKFDFYYVPKVTVDVLI